MRKVRCEECGKRYDFDVDDFCPRCGAFNQPPRSSRIPSDGSLVRTEGIHEGNHSQSFVHAEFHEENRRRQGTPLARGRKRSVRAGQKTGAPKTRPAAKPFRMIGWIVLVLILLNVFSNFIGWVMLW